MKRLTLTLCLVLAALAAGSRAPMRVQASAVTACPLTATPGVGACPGTATIGLQNAINAATPGTTINLVSGCYFENLSIIGIPSPGITIQSISSAGVHTPATSLTGPGPNDPCFQTPTTTAGVYIDGGCGLGNVPPTSGAGLPTVYIQGSFVSFEGVTIQDGCDTTFGVGISDIFHGAGGVYIDAESSVQITNSWIFYNVNDNPA